MATIRLHELINAVQGTHTPGTQLQYHYWITSESKREDLVSFGTMDNLSDATHSRRTVKEFLECSTSLLNGMISNTHTRQGHDILEFLHDTIAVVEFNPEKSAAVDKGFQAANIPETAVKDVGSSVY